MKFTKQELQVIRIWRMVKKISQEKDNGYYSVEITPTDIGRSFYLPKKGHVRCNNFEEAMNILKRLDKMSIYQYQYDIEKLRNRILEIKKKRETLTSELKNLQKEYDMALKGFDAQIEEKNKDDSKVKEK